MARKKISFGRKAKMIDGDVRIKRGPYKDRVGEVIDCLPDFCQVRIGRKIVWLSRRKDLEFIKPKHQRRHW